VGIVPTGAVPTQRWPRQTGWRQRNAIMLPERQLKRQT